MPDHAPDLPRPPERAQRYINRELSWLAFNARVIDQAYDTSNPLLERLNFLAISASNLDEFYNIRVSGLKAQVENEVTLRGDDGRTPAETLDAALEASAAMILRQHDCWQALRQEMAKAGIVVTGPDKLSRTDRVWLREFFRRMVLPLLTPIAVDPAHPFPLIPNRGVALVLQMRDPDGETARHLVPLPHQIGRFVRLGAKADGKAPLRFILLEQVILQFLDDLVPGFTLEASGMFRILRSTELEWDERAEDLIRTFENALRKRNRGQLIRLSIHRDTPPHLRAFLQQEMRADGNDLHIVSGLNGLADLKELVDCGRDDLRFPRFEPRYPERIRDYEGDAFAAIRAKDFVIHHPYESFDVVVHFLRQAAADPKVLAIKQTLYRTSADSPIVQALAEAALAGKSVTAMIELKARFDEEANIRWARNLEQAGAQVVYGFVGLKTHAKISMVVRDEDGPLRTYVHFGTGNYHPQTARVYTDLSFFTCDPAIARDAGALFNYMTGYAEPKTLEKCLFAPATLRNSIARLIGEEIAHARAGRPAAIWIKLNALIDAGIIDRLYEASAAGVAVNLVVRGMCALRPGVPGLSENITVRSIVGRFLEHSRIFCFGAGHGLPSPRARIYISSADMMPRNLDRRIEVMMPVENPTVHQQLLGQIMLASFKDNRNCWDMDGGGTYCRRAPAGDETPFTAHDYFMKNPSLSGRGSGLLRGTRPPELALLAAAKGKGGLTGS